MKPVTIEQVVGDIRAAIKAIGVKGQVELMVVKRDGVILHEVRRSRLLEEDWRRLMETPPHREVIGR